MITWIVDTGPLIAYLDATEPDHDHVTTRLDGFAGRLVTTSAVVTEAMHLVSRAPDGPRVLAQLLLAWDVEVHDFSKPSTLPHVVDLMERYDNVPMDYADATLVLLAEARDSHDVVTLDRRGFSTYRTRDGRALTDVLDS